jgi:uncharacterized coiled-coil DUF342 family protein
MAYDDFEQHAQVATDEQIKGISFYAGKAVELSQQIEGLEEILKSAKAELHNITNKLLPEAMTEAGCEMFKHDSGTVITIKQVVAGSLPKEEDARERAFTWLKAHDGEDLIKEKLEVSFDRGQGNISSAAKAALEELEIEYKAKMDVHPQTLAAYARERLKHGEEVDTEILGLFIGRTAKLEFRSK